MDIILRKDVDNLGYKNDIVTVKNGYARNYLIPKGFAILASDKNKKILAENLKQAAHKMKKIVDSATELKEKLEALNIEVKVKVGEKGKLYGSVTAQQIAEIINQNGFEIDKRKIKLSEDIKILGEFDFLIDLHKEVKAEMKINVISEHQEEPQAEEQIQEEQPEEEKQEDLEETDTEKTENID